MKDMDSILLATKVQITISTAMILLIIIPLVPVKHLMKELTICGITP